jgi:hypothetical protein
MFLGHRLALAMTLALGGFADARTPPPSVHADATEFKEHLEKCDTLIEARKLDDAIRWARSLEASSGYELARLASYAQVTAMLHRNGWYEALAVLEGVMHRDRAAGNAEGEALDQDTATWIRWSLETRAGRSGALDENERTRQTVESSNLADDVKRQVMLRYWWNRAYLMLNYALEHATDATAAQATDEARRRYEALARQPDQHDHEAALAVYFAVRCDGARRRYEEEDRPDQQDRRVLLAVY